MFQSGFAQVHFTHDGRHIAVNRDGTPVLIWNIKEDKFAAIPRARSALSPAVSPHAAYARAESGGVIAVAVMSFIHDNSSKQKPFTLAGHEGELTAISFSPDGSRLASAATDKTLRIWDLKDGVELHKLANRSPSATALRFSRNARLLAAASGSTIDVWDAKAGKRLAGIRSSLKQVRDLAFSTKRNLLAVVGAGKSIELWNSTSGKLMKRIPSTDAELRAAAFSLDGRVLAVGGRDTTFRIFDLETSKSRAAFTGHSAAVTRLLFLSETEIASGSETGQVFTWNVRKPKEPVTKRYLGSTTNSIGDMQLSKDGYLSVSGGNNSLMRFNARDRDDRGRMLYVQSDTKVRSFRLTPDGKTVLAAFRTGIRTFDLATGREIAKASADSRWGYAMSADGRRLYLPGPKGLVELDMKTGKETVRVPPVKWGRTWNVFGVSSGGRLVTGRREIVGWDMKTWREAYRISENVWGPSSVIGFSPDRGVLISHQLAAKQLRFLDADTGVIIRSWPLGQFQSSAAKLSPDGLTVAAYDRAPQSLVVRELLTGKVVLRFSGSPRSHSFLDETTLVVAMRDGTALSVSLKPKEVVKTVDVDALPRLWKDLSSDDGPTAYRAYFAMSALKDRAVAFLQTRVKPAAAGQIAESRSLWAVHVLRRIGTPMAVKTLKSLAAAPPAPLTWEAQRALRLINWKSK
jgi:WD40 repeat protein